jgi:hypothetical protein
MGKIKKLQVISFAKFQATLGALVGLLAGSIYSFGGLFIDILVTLNWVVTSETPGLSYGTVLAFGALIGMPLIGVIAGFILGFISSLLYNIFAKRFGGVHLETSID